MGEIDMSRARPLTLAILVCAVGVAHAQSDWRPTKVSALAIAQKAEKAMKSFKGVDGAVTIQFQGPEGKGTGQYEPKFRNPKTFRLDHAIMPSPGSDKGFTREYVISDGSGR